MSSAGVAGSKGDTGPMGIPGPVGFPGTRGVKGDIGVRGSVGDKGQCLMGFVLDEIHKIKFLILTSHGICLFRRQRRPRSRRRKRRPRIQRSVNKFEILNSIVRFLVFIFIYLFLFLIWYIFTNVLKSLVPKSIFHWHYNPRWSYQKCKIFVKVISIICYYMFWISLLIKVAENI